MDHLAKNHCRFSTIKREQDKKQKMGVYVSNLLQTEQTMKLGKEKDWRCNRTADRKRAEFNFQEYGFESVLSVLQRKTLKSTECEESLMITYR